ncbi:MAG: DUF559 domain-containing protein, partial [Actinomycetes bacterium]|nr:DUF559 domain-containing protein [Actinomycetes bacterium]
LIPVDAALHAGLLTLEEAVESGRRGGFDAAWIRHMADPRAESPAETRARVQILGAGYEVRSQVELESVGRVDFVVEGKVVVETDGKDYHSDERAFIRDKRRDRAVIKRGMTPLRYAAKEALQWPELVTADLLAVLGPPVRSGAPPRPRRARSRR